MSWNGDREPWEIPDREIYSSPEKDPWERKQPEQEALLQHHLADLLICGKSYMLQHQTDFLFYLHL